MNNDYSALLTWLNTFPQVQQYITTKTTSIDTTTNQEQKENQNNNEIFDILEDPNVSRGIYNIAKEIFEQQGGDGGVGELMPSSPILKNDDAWERIIQMTSSRKVNSKRIYRESSSLPSPTITTPTNSIGSEESLSVDSWKDFEKRKAMTKILEGAVSHPNIDRRKVYVENIMKLSAEKQRILMALIEQRKTQKKKKKKKQRTATTTTHREVVVMNNNNNNNKKHQTRFPFSPKQVNADWDVSVTPNSERLVVVSRESQSPFFTPRRTRGGSSFSFSTPTPTLQQEKKIKELEKENKRLLRDLCESRETEKEMVEKLEDMKFKLVREMVKVEARSRQREQETRDLCNLQVGQLKLDLKRMSIQCQDAEKTQAEMIFVKEEMENMEETKGILDNAMDRMRQYKGRAEQLEQVKEALRQEELAHGRSVEECLRLQDEVKVLQPVKRQLEEYKALAERNESMRRVCKFELIRNKQKLQECQDAKVALEKKVEHQKDEIETLNYHIRLGNVGVSATTISELNPKLKGEALRIQMKLKKLKLEREEEDDDDSPTTTTTISRRASTGASSSYNHNSNFEINISDSVEEGQEEVGKNIDNEFIAIQVKPAKSRNTTKVNSSPAYQRVESSPFNDMMVMSSANMRNLVQLQRKEATRHHEEMIRQQEEVQRLSEENNKLKSTAKRVMTLENQVEASNRLCERYKEQFLATKVHLERTQLDLEDVMLEFYQSVELFGQVSRREGSSSSSSNSTATSVSSHTQLKRTKSF